MGLQQTLKALADPTRREILNLLKNKRRSAGKITEHFDITAAAISRHLSVLKEQDIIVKRNNFGNCRLDPHRLGITPNHRGQRCAVPGSLLLSQKIGKFP